MLAAVFVGTAILTAVAPDQPGGPAARAAPPRTFFAVRRVGAEIVEIDSGTGRVVRPLVDLGGPDAAERTGGLIDGIDLAADGRALWFSRFSAEPGVVYRLMLANGQPERVTDGHGASVSPDGRYLALIRRSDVVIRDLTTAHERVFTAMAGDLGGVQTAWSDDGRHVAVEISGADVSGVEILDTVTGETVAPKPEGDSAVNYRVISPRYRPSDGLLGVVCCHDGEIVEGEPPQNTELVLHDPITGVEQSRVRLPFSAWALDWDTTGTHLLLTDGDRVHHWSGGRFRDVPEINGVYGVAW